MAKKEWKLKDYLVKLMVAGMLLFPLKLCAAEAENPDIVSVKLPVMKEVKQEPFDFFLDPQGLLYETGAARYGGRNVEADATLYFANQEGEYGFSRYSDRVTVENLGGEPVRVTVNAKIEDLGRIEMTGKNDFSDSRTCSMYLAVTDSRGNETPLSNGEAVTVAVELGKEEEYSFGLTGACNAAADWTEVSVHPVVTVIWKVEPVAGETEDTEEPEEEATETETGAEAETEIETETETETETGPEAETETETGLETGVETGSETDTEVETETENETETEIETESGTETLPESEIETEGKAETENGAAAGTESSAEAESGAENGTATVEEAEKEAE